MNGETRGTAAQPLLYWLAIVIGLVGITIVRFDTPSDVTPIWIGTILGVLLGQLLAAARIRAWVPIAVLFGGIWFIAPALLFALFSAFGRATEPGLLAFVPAAIGGYLSLSNRGAIIAFWYPAVLWMTIILDGPTATNITSAAVLPFVIALGALFIAFLRARETRRVALWRTHSHERLGTPIAQTILRASPMRALLSVVWAASIGAVAVALAIWIAPHLWQREKELRKAVLTTYEPGYASEECCQGAPEHERIKEYFPLVTGEENKPHRSCRVCSPPATVASATHDEWSYSGTPGSGFGGVATAPYAPPSYNGYGSNNGYGGTYAYEPLPVAPAAAPTLVTHGPYQGLPVPPPTTSPTPVSMGPVGPKPVTPSAPSPPATMDPIVLGNTAAPDAPWGWMLGFCSAAFALHIVGRMLRRRIVLQHLTEPFWNEHVDQRISNHWQRILIGLRDAGIFPKRDEQPSAFARRVGIEGMEACATILERVRHGVQVDASDVVEMDRAASKVYRASRERAGFMARVVSWLRWPLV